MKHIPYYEQLRDPRWQKKRLEIMQRDDFKCRSCGGKNETLNVHHKHYYADTKCWDYDDELLITLCETCHKEIKEVRESVLLWIDRHFDNIDQLKTINNILSDLVCFRSDNRLKYISKIIEQSRYLFTGEIPF